MESDQEMNRNEHLSNSWLRRRATALLIAALQLGGADAVVAKTGQLIHRSIPEKGDTTHVVVPGERFKAGRLQRGSTAATIARSG